MLVVYLNGLASCGWHVTEELEVGRLVVMSDWRERHALYILGETWEVGEWQDEAGGESMVIEGVREVRDDWMRGARSRDDGDSILQGV